MLARMLSWSGSRCWMTTKAGPGSGGRCPSSFVRASRPPPEAPIPTMGMEAEGPAESGAVSGFGIFLNGVNNYLHNTSIIPKAMSKDPGQLDAVSVRKQFPVFPGAVVNFTQDMGDPDPQESPRHHVASPMLVGIEAGERDGGRRGVNGHHHF